MKRLVQITLAAAVLVLATGVGPVPESAAQSGVKVGVLNCNVAGGWGLVFGSSKNVNCTFSPQEGTVETYTGEIGKFGADIGYSKAAVLVWAVWAPTSDVKPGALKGSYGGVTGGASVGVGAGANVLVGGSNKTINLQPLSIEGTVGLNVAAGIAALTLK
jgi:hypothetical protein